MGLRRIYRKVVPGPLRVGLRNLQSRATDRLEVLLGRRDPLTPPRRMWGLVTDPELDFNQAGEHFRTFLIESCGLKPDECVLDVGCGVGRNAVPLIGYLGPGGSYYGFDIMPEAISWCQKNITPRHPNFHFHLADIHNKTYNPGGKYEASEYEFPYPDDTFDLAFLVSVFTHMLPAGVRQYRSEIARVLKPGGRCAISYYLVNDSARKNMRAGLGVFDFKFDLGGCYAQDEESPEAAVAYEERDIRAMYEDCGLTIKEPILFGDWSSSKVQSQDIVIAFKDG